MREGLLELATRKLGLSPAWLVFVFGASLSVILWHATELRVQRDAKEHFQAAVKDATLAVEQRLWSCYDVLLGAKSLFRATPQVTRDTFHRYVSGLNLRERYPSMRGVTYARLVSGDMRTAFEAEVRGDKSLAAAGYPGFGVKPAGERSEYLPIVYMEPMVGNPPGFGLDLIADARRETVEQTRDNGAPALSGRIAILSDPLRRPAFTVRLAVYRNGMPDTTVEERRAAFSGIVSASFLVRELVGDIMGHAALNPVHVQIYDGGIATHAIDSVALTADQLLFDKPASVPQARLSALIQELPLEMGGRRWHLRFAGTPNDFLTATDRMLPWLVFLAGMSATLLLCGLMRSVMTVGDQAVTLAERITEDLRTSEARLVEAQRLTHSMIEALPNPIFFKDTDGRYRGVNKAWESFFGIPRDAFVGKTVFELYPHDKPVAERLDAMDQVLWQHPGTQVYETVISKSGGKHHDVVYYKATYEGSDGNVAGLIGTIVDMTERKQTERRQAMEHAITRVLAEAESLADVVPKIIQTVCNTMGWHYGARYEHDHDAELLRCREQWGIDTPEIGEFMASVATRVVKADRTGGGLIRRAFQTGKPVWISDIAQEKTLQRTALVAKAGLHGAFAFPLKGGAEVLGVMEFFHSDVLEPDPMVIQIAESIGSQIGQFMVRMQAEEAVKFVAMHDSLTSLPNRVMFNQRLEHAIAHSERHGRKLAVMFIDLDRFKVINDTLGHEAGDSLLREVAQRLNENLRTGDTVARLGGDEFVVLLEDVAAPLDLGTVAQKLISALIPNYVIAGREVHITASIGVSTYPADATDMRSLLRYADIAMYRAKELGRNTFQFYSSQMNEHSVEQLTLESQLRGALQREELVLHYQPMIDSKTGYVIGMEALVRWRHPEGELLLPGRFIGLAEETGLIVPIGEWVLEKACEQQREWEALGVPPVKVSVNLSPRQFMHSDLVQDIVRVIARTGCNARYLELEITEGTVMHNAERAVAILGQLKEMGIRVAVDDFGTGYSSLAYLKRFPIDSLKIDRSFIADIPADAGNRAITEAIIAMAHRLGLRVIAEGVETKAQLDFLRRHHCEEMQGYYFGEPLPAAAATALLQRSFAIASTVKVTTLRTPTKVR